MTADEIRATYAEVLGRAEYEQDRQLNVVMSGAPPWEAQTDGQRDYYRSTAVGHLLDALTAAGLLPVYMDRRMAREPSGQPLGHLERQFLTAWRPLEDSCLGCRTVWGDCRPPDRRCCANCSHPFREQATPNLLP